MSYQVLARKWRPRTFAELVGQEHVLKALVNALDNDRLHHAYLFTGTRGVGKTTIARILAKSLNCEQGISATPCGICSACVEISEGRFVDLIEVDAASRTKVEDTRELLENVQYRPTRGRYKVYLIDEVHMLSGHSFNALLKTLEEPPPHVKFLLATTDPQKLPVTILSRCLQFNLKHLSVERISGHLQNVLNAEHIPFEEPALLSLARAADGSMRDALSLTDQAIAHGGGQVTEAEVTSMLGTINRQEIQELCRALVVRDAAGVLATTARMAEFSPDYGQALGEMLAIWHRVAIAQQVPEAVDNSLGDQELVMQLAAGISPEDVQLFYQIGLLGRRDLPHAADPRSGFEMVLLRQLAFQPQGVTPPAGPPPGRSIPERSMESAGPARVAVPAADEGSLPNPPAAPQATVSERTGPPGESLPPQSPVAESVAVEQQPEPPAAFETATPVAEPIVEPTEAPVAIPLKKQEPAVAGAVYEAERERQAPTRPLMDEPPFEVDQRDYSSEDSYFSGGSDFNRAPSVPEHRGPWQQEEGEPVSSVVAERSVVPKEEPPADDGREAEEVMPSRLAEVPSGDPWLDLYSRLQLGGILNNTASNLALVSQEGSRWHFVIDGEQSALFEAEHQDRLAEVLTQYLGTTQQVMIEAGELTAETPARRANRIREERRLHAVATLRQDPLVAELLARFSGRLLEQTVVPRET